MNIVLSSGHGAKIRGASGYLDEVDEARRVVEQVAGFLRAAAVNVKTFHDDTSTSQDQNLKTIVNYHNAQSRQLDVSVHFNAYQTTSKAMGTECLYLTQPTLASDVSWAIADAGAFINRGAKKRTDLYFLNKTEEPAILIEVCFVDSSTDAELYRQHFDSICEAIAESISGVQVPDEPSVPVESEPEPEPGEPARVEIYGTIHGDVVININGQDFVRGNDPDTPNRVSMTLATEGEVVVTVNGQDYHNIEDGEVQANHRDITATVFGGTGDYNVSAYDENLVLNDTDLYVALPLKIGGKRPRVRLYNKASDLEATAEILDVGPWMIDDDAYVFGNDRPLAELCFLEGVKLPSGPHAGKVPSNPAGIDLSPALASALRIEGKGVVDWEMLDESKGADHG